MSILLGSTAVPLKMWRGHLNRLKSGFRGLIFCPGWDEQVEDSHRNNLHTDKVSGDLLCSLSSLPACAAKSSLMIRRHLFSLHRGAIWRNKRRAPSRVLGVTGYLWSHLRCHLDILGQLTSYNSSWTPQCYLVSLLNWELSRTNCGPCYDRSRR